MKVLLIWEEIPEYTKYIELEPGSYIHKLAREACGYYIGAEENEAIQQLSEDLLDLKLFDCDKTPLTGPFTEVIICGRVL